MSGAYLGAGTLQDFLIWGHARNGEDCEFTQRVYVLQATLLRSKSLCIYWHGELIRGGMLERQNFFGLQLHYWFGLTQAGLTKNIIKKKKKTRLTITAGVIGKLAHGLRLAGNCGLWMNEIFTRDQTQGRFWLFSYFAATPKDGALRSYIPKEWESASNLDPNDPIQVGLLDTKFGRERGPDSYFLIPGMLTIEWPTHGTFNNSIVNGIPGEFGYERRRISQKWSGRG